MYTDELIDAYKYLDKTTSIYGEPGTGKTTILFDIMHKLKDHIPIVIVFSSSDMTNHTYGDVVIPRGYVHSSVTAAYLQSSVINRQTDIMAKYVQTTDIDVLERISNYIPGHESRYDIVTKLNDQLAGVAEDERNMIKDTMVKIYRTAISGAIKNGELLPSALSERENAVLAEIDLNPRIVLIFDDVTTDIERIKTSTALKDIYFKSRHLHITVLMAVHKDDAVHGDIRRCVFVNIFTSIKAISNYLNKNTSGFTNNAENKRMLEQAHTIFDNKTAPFQKLMMLRDGTLLPYTAIVHDKFKMCHSAIWVMHDACAKIAAINPAPITSFLDEYYE